MRREFVRGAEQSNDFTDWFPSLPSRALANPAPRALITHHSAVVDATVISYEYRAHIVGADIVTEVNLDPIPDYCTVWIDDPKNIDARVVFLSNFFNRLGP